MYNNKYIFFGLLSILLVSRVVWARCVCDPGDTGCLEGCVSKVRNCIELCSNSSEGACRNSCIKSYWTGPSRQNRQPDLNEEEVGSAEAMERTIPEPTKHIKNLYANQPYTVTNPTAAAAYTPAPTPQGVMGQLIPFIVTALGGGEPYVKGHPGTYGQPNVNGQPYAQGQNGAGAHRQPNANGQPKPTEQPVQPTLNIPEQPNMNGQPNTNSQPNMDGQPTMDNQPNVNGQPNMNDQPNMNGQPNINGQPNTNAQPNLNGQQPGANAQPTMVVPPHPTAVATDPSLLTTHTTVLSLTTLTPSMDPSFVPSNIFHLSQGARNLVDHSALLAIGFALLFATHNLI